MLLLLFAISEDALMEYTKQGLMKEVLCSGDFV